MCDDVILRIVSPLKIVNKNNDLISVQNMAKLSWVLPKITYFSQLSLPLSSHVEFVRIYDDLPMIWTKSQKCLPNLGLS